MKRILAIALNLAVLTFATSAVAADTAPYGILLLAHGGSEVWNARVTELADVVDSDIPTEVAFGMATRSAIQSAVEGLEARGVQRIVAVPLFVSSHSSVITSTEFLLGLRDTAPPQLAMFAKMSHGNGGHGAHGGHGETDTSGTTPVESSVPITMTAALNDHPIVAEILLSRVRELSRNPAGEAVIVVAHGPVSDEDNAKWLDDMAGVVGHMKSLATFDHIQYLTVRDDASKEIRDAAANELRTMAENALSDGRSVIISPLLISSGGIEKGIHERLEGIEYVMPAQGLLPHPRLVDWVRLSASNEAARWNEVGAVAAAAPAVSRQE